MKADRNRTIDITVEEGKEYLERCISVSKEKTLNEVLDKTILGDTFEVLRLLPKHTIDLLIVDPPYNVDKNFHGNIFRKNSDDIYE